MKEEEESPQVVTNVRGIVKSTAIPKKYIENSVKMSYGSCGHFFFQGSTLSLYINLSDFTRVACRVKTPEL